MADEPLPRSVLLIGDGALPRAVEIALIRAGASVRRLRRPNDRQIAVALEAHFDVTLVVSRDDVEVLRMALVVEHARPGRRLIVTVFNRTVASQLRSAVPGCQVTSMADAVATTIAGPCIAEGLESLAELPDGFVGVCEAGDGVEVVPLRIGHRSRASRWLHAVRGALRPFDPSARFLVAGLAGFALILILDTVVTGLTLHEPAIDAFYGATKALVTVGSNPAVDRAGPGSKLGARAAAPGVAVGARVGAGDPLAGAVGQRGAAVQRRGDLHAHPRAPAFHAREEPDVELARAPRHGVRPAWPMAMPAAAMRAVPWPLTSGLGSPTAISTRPTPAATSASQHGGVLAGWAQGSSVT